MSRFETIGTPITALHPRQRFFQVTENDQTRSRFTSMRCRRGRVLGWALLLITASPLVGRAAAEEPAGAKAPAAAPAAPSTPTRHLRALRQPRRRAALGGAGDSAAGATPAPAATEAPPPAVDAIPALEPVPALPEAPGTPGRPRRRLRSACARCAHDRRRADRGRSRQRGRHYVGRRAIGLQRLRRRRRRHEPGEMIVIDQIGGVRRHHRRGGHAAPATRGSDYEKDAPSVG